MRPLGVLLAAACLVTSSCAFLRDPQEPWQASVHYQLRGPGAVSVPDRIQVDGSFGYIELTNETFVRRGFAIDELAVYEQVRPDSGTRVTVDEAEDGKTYRFYDHLHPEDGPRGTIVVRYVDEDAR